MELFEWQPDYSHKKQIGDPLNYYDTVLRCNKERMETANPIETEKLKIWSMVCNFEMAWYAEGKPYYKIYPQMIDEFIRTPIAIPCDMLHCAHTAFEIRLPKTPPIIDFKVGDQQWQVTNILVNAFLLEEKRFWWIIMTSYPVPKPADPGQGFNSFIVMHFDTPGKSIEDYVTGRLRIDADPTRPSPHYPDSVVEACIRLVTGVCFLSTGSHKILQYDVLNKLLDKYRRLDPEIPEQLEERKRIDDKSKRRGKYGWTIGSDLTGRHLKLPVGITYAEAVKTAGGREQLYSHTRGGHWRELIPGENKPWKKYTVIWIDRMVIHPDKPAKPVV